MPTSYLPRSIGQSLDLLFGENTQDNDTVKAFFKAFLGLVKSFGVDKSTIDLGPTSTRWNALLGSL